MLGIIYTPFLHSYFNLEFCFNLIILATGARAIKIVKVCLVHKIQFWVMVKLQATTVPTLISV